MALSIVDSGAFRYRHKHVSQKEVYSSSPSPLSIDLGAFNSIILTLFNDKHLLPLSAFLADFVLNLVDVVGALLKSVFDSLER